MGKATVTQPPSNPPPYNKPSVVTTSRVGNASQANSLLSLKREKESQIELPSKQIKQDAKNSQTWTHEEILAVLHWLSNRDNLTSFRSNALAQYKVMEQKLDIGKTAGQIQRQLEFLGEKYKLIRIRSSMEKPTSPEKQKEANCKSFQYFSLMDDIFGDDNNKRSQPQQAPTRSQTLAMGPGPGAQQSGKKSESSQTYFYLPKPIRPSQIKNNNTNLNSTTNGAPPVNKPKHSATVSALPSSTATFNRPPPTRGETLPTTNFKRLMPSNGQGPHERFDRTYPVLGSHHHHQGESYSPIHDDGELSPLQSQVLRKKLHLLETQERYLEEQRQDMVIERNQNQAQLDMISKNLLSLNQQIEKQSQILMDLVSQLRDQKK